MKPIKTHQLFLLYAVLAIVLRFFSFFPAVINHDESTYILIAAHMLDGDLYFVDVIDTKPVGIFIIYAVFHQLFAGSIFLMRLAAAMALACTAFLIARVSIRIDGNGWAGVAAGVLYLMLNSIFTFYGVSPNTETYFNLFTALGLWIFLDRKAWYWYLMAGLVMGLGFMVKYVVMFDGLAFGLFLIIDYWRQKKPMARALGFGLLMAIGAAMPLLVTALYYQQLGHLDAFWFYTFQSSGRYPVTQTWDGYLVYVLDFLLRFLPITFFFFLAMFHRGVSSRLKWLGGLWSSLVLIVILIPGKQYGHYFIHLMLPFSLVAGSVFGLPRQALPRWLAFLLKPQIGYSILAVLILANTIIQKIDYWDKPDHPRLVANFIKDQLGPEDGIYTTMSHQIIHHLVDRRSPLKHVHPSLFWEQKHIKALEIDVAAEQARITDQPPKFIIWRTDLKDDRLDQFLLDHYVLVKRFGREWVYERRDF